MRCFDSLERTYTISKQRERETRMGRLTRKPSLETRDLGVTKSWLWRLKMRSRRVFRIGAFLMELWPMAPI